MTIALTLGALALHRGNVLGIVALAGLLVALEQAFALREQPTFRGGWGTDLAHFIVNRAFLEFAVFGALAAVAKALQLLVPAAVPDAVGDQHYLLQLAEVLLLVELGTYWSHRMLHSVPFLWRIHRLHHSSAELDWLSAVRQHPLDLALSHAWTFVPLVVLGFSPSVWGLVFIIGTAQGLFVHSNLRLTFGPLKWIVTTPEFHHWHHADYSEAYDSNFAFAFPAVDVLFGTLYLPQRQRPARLGVGQPAPDAYFRQLLWPFATAKPIEQPQCAVDAGKREPQLAGVSSSSTWWLIRQRNRVGENDSAWDRIAIASKDRNSKSRIARASRGT